MPVLYIVLSGGLVGAFASGVLHLTIDMWQWHVLVWYNALQTAVLAELLRQKIASRRGYGR